MTSPEFYEVLRYSVSLVTQGRQRFYTLTMPSEVLAKTCYVSDRYEDPVEGFQRSLDQNRAREIAEYIDNGLGTIPSSIILSAQPQAQLKIVGQGKTLEFVADPKAFLVIDGQHRVYGFSFAETNLRVPVVIYNGLSRSDEAKIFIDVNSKQKPVPNELLLDIKRLADYENESEGYLRDIFDEFDKNVSSSLYGMLSPAKSAKNKISRVTFNLGIKPIMKTFSTKSRDEVFKILDDYIKAVRFGLTRISYAEGITKPNVFRALMDIFPEVAQRVKSSGEEYSFDAFWEILLPMFDRTKQAVFKKPASSYKAISEELEKSLKIDFKL